MTTIEENTQSQRKRKRFKRIHKPPLDFWGLWNMSFGFFGIQFGWTLQMANTSAIYEYLGASAEQLPLLWLAAPVSGLIAQPIIGYMSDRTWGPLGRRRPYFLVGAIIASVALILMPNSSSLWMAAGLLWILDTSINISMEPFRAFVADLLPEKQRTDGFAMQAFFIGLGAVIASIFPWMLNNIFEVGRGTDGSSIPLTVKLSFYLGAVVFLGTVLWTIITTKEYPPADLEAFKKRNEESKGLGNAFKELWQIVRNMPPTMRQLAWVQFFTWLGMFCVVLYLAPAIAHGIFGAVSERSSLYTDGIEWAGVCIGVYNAVCFLFSLVISTIADITSRKWTYGFCLFCGGAGLMSMLVIRDQYLLLLPMVCFGIAWASMLAMPYAILSDALPVENTGVYMGLFNAFIVIPQIIASLGLGWVMYNVLNNDRLLAIVLGGVCLIIAAGLVARVDDVGQEDNAEQLALKN
jgi:maltose/moltooligosaccharide transporter